MPINPTNIAIVDDHALFRKTLKNYLSEQKGINIVIEAADMRDLLSRLQNTPTDVVIMDLFLPGLNGNEAVKTMRSEYQGVKILVLSMSLDLDLISDLLDSGIHGYISKSDEPENLVQAIRTVSENQLYHNKIFTEALYWNKQNNIRSHAENPLAPLNEREKKILQLIWEEKSNKEIADDLFLGIRSVEKIRQDIKEKIGAKSTIGLLKYAIEKRIIGIGSRSPGLIR
ncbi:response regulator transcription factor [Puia sp.]|jgi:DNA-binding NarL/FixJ family response regulator|uniref:response regulator transcription factor n=1 Tax=Puia sp. TaxID=2045100 RepID=UPI002F423E48